MVADGSDRVEVSEAVRMPNMIKKQPANLSDAASEQPNQGGFASPSNLLNN